MSYHGYKLDKEQPFDTDLSVAEIYPVGSLSRMMKSSDNIERFDIIFPINISYDLTAGQPFISGKVILEWQKKILNYLDECGLKVCIKPHVNLSKTPNSIMQSFAVYPFLEKKKNCYIDDSVSFQYALEKYNPRLVVLEMFSTPLYDAVNFDCDIIQLIDPYFIPGRDIVEKLNKRIHIANNIDDMLNYIEEFSDGKLQKRRENDFYDELVCPPGLHLPSGMKYAKL